MKIFLHGVFTVFLCCFALSGFCFAKDHPIQQSYEASDLYKHAKDLFDKKKFKEAKKSFQKVYDINPISKCGKKARLMAALCDYYAKNYADSAALAEAYIAIYANDNDKDMQYISDLRAGSYLHMSKDIEYGTHTLVMAKECYQYILDKFPNSKYAKNASSKLLLIQDKIDAKSLYIAIFYQKHGHYHAAISRFLKILNQSKNHKYKQEAMFRLAQSYKAIGLEREAKRYFLKLKKNNSGWVKLI